MKITRRAITEEPGERVAERERVRSVCETEGHISVCVCVIMRESREKSCSVCVCVCVRPLDFDFFCAAAGFL